MPSWRHPGGKLRELGPQALTDAELLAILIGTGIPGRSAEAIAREVIRGRAASSQRHGRSEIFR